MDKFEAAFVAILLLAAVLRFYGLSERPLHSDEAVHAHFAFELPTRYTYDPIYHGPFLYHVTALSFALLGPTPFSLRLPQVLFGIGLIALLWPLRREQYLGKTGVLVSASLLALSPSFVYYSRFAIHDSFFAFFTLGTLVFSLLYTESRKPAHLYAASAMLALLFTVKENAYLVAAIFALSRVLINLMSAKPISSREGFGEVWNCRRPVYQNPLSAFLGCKRPPKPKHLLVAFLVFAFVFAFFYSSMFRNPGSLALGMSAPVKTWLDKAQSWVGHQKPAFYYVSLFVIYELPTVVFGLAGSAAALAKRKNRFLTFVSLWAVLTLATYFLIKYKTPWLTVNMALPLALAGGAFAGRIFERKKRLAVALFILLLAFSTVAMARVNFERPSSPMEPLVYVQTSEDVAKLVRIVDGIAAQQGGRAAISVISTDYWPLPFYFRNYEAGYWTGDVPGQIEAEIVLTSAANEKKVAEILNGDYKKIGVFKLREWYGAGYTFDRLVRFLVDGTGYRDTGSFDLAFYLKK